MIRTPPGGLPPYVFSQLDARRRAAGAGGRALVDLGIGSPDLPVDPGVVTAIRDAAADPALSGYPPFRIHPALAAAVHRFLHERFAVATGNDPALLATAGSKEGLAEVVLSRCGPGDVVLAPAVHYPVYARSAILAGAEPGMVPLTGDGRMDLDAVPPDQLRRARVLIVNYPSNPTTATVDLAELARLVAFAQRHTLLLVNDLAYSELAFDGYRPPSVLEVAGALDVAVELHSCSKSFSLAGIRVGVLVGRADLLATVEDHRMTTGYGVSTLSQHAAAAAFARHAAIVPPTVAAYAARRDAAVSAFRAAGWAVTPPRATMYLWLPIPDGFADDWAWVDALLDGPGVVVAPGVAFGDAGRGRFRVSLVRPPEVLARAAGEIAAVAAAAR